MVPKKPQRLYLWDLCTTWQKACGSHLIKEDLLIDTVLTDIQELVKQIDKEQYLKKLEAQ
ncbi:MAG TPA: hypothetical protein VEY70_23840 [Metabacillus sp.]|nr:hypothetical protein [Metabacillus sp.]